MNPTVPQIPNPISSFEPGALLANLINLLLIWGAAAAVLFIIVGGFRFIFSGGNQEGVEKARQTVVYAVLGMVIIFLSYLAVNYILTDLLQVKPAYQLTS